MAPVWGVLWAGGLIMAMSGSGAWAQGMGAAGAGAQPPEAALRSGDITVPGGTLFYEARGSGSATIILIHDGLVHRETWDGQFTEFARDYHVVRYDRRGYGRSPLPTASYSNLADLRAVFEQLAIERATLIGMSAGGGLAVDYALAYPEQVEALVLVGAVVSGMGYTEHMLTRGGHYTRGQMSSPEAEIAYWTGTDPYDIAPQNTDARARIRRLLEANPQNVNADIGRLQQAPARPALPMLGEIHVPTLIVVGEWDIPDVHAHAGALAAGIPGARRTVLSGAAHLVPVEQPEAFNTLVLGFLLGKDILTAIEAGRFDEARARLATLRAQRPGIQPFTEGTINGMGYAALQQGDAPRAIAIFELYVAAYPESWNAYDSLGEALAAQGDRAAAIRAYEKSLELNPANENGRQFLERLRRGN
jgi:3-oxoadipate enol-lactonase